ncbi:MAG: glycosyltransferase family 4 protein [Rikenellaceae bacterium]
MQVDSYKELKEHYKEMLELFDVVHFNSSVTESVYEKHLDINSSKVIPITHLDIVDNREERCFNEKILKLIFIGNTAAYKGFPLLEELLIELYNEGKREWCLEVWGADGKSNCENISFKGRYSSEDLKKVYSSDSLLIVPSLCSETFSLATLEALSFGLPVMVSSSVGAKDIVARHNDWFIFKDRLDLKTKLIRLLDDREPLIKYNRLVVQSSWNYSLKEHSKEIEKLYRK